MRVPRPDGSGQAAAPFGVTTRVAPAGAGLTPPLAPVAAQATLRRMVKDAARIAAVADLLLAMPPSRNSRRVPSNHDLPQSLRALRSESLLRLSRSLHLVPNLGQRAR